MNSRNIFLFLFMGTAMFLLTGCGPKYTIEEQETYTLALNKGGQTLGYAPASGVALIEQNGYAFKDLNKNGELDLYEDWSGVINDKHVERYR
jgi:beta-glucosidase